MSLLDGERASWRHKDEVTGEPTRIMEGRVASVSRSGTPASWSVLVLRDDGTLETHTVDDVVIQTGRPAKIPWAEAEAIDQLEAIMAGRAATPEDAIRGDTPRDYVPNQWGAEIQGAGPVERAVWYITKQAEESAKRGAQLIKQRVTLEAYEKGMTEGAAQIAQLEATIAQLKKGKKDKPAAEPAKVEAKNEVVAQTVVVEPTAKAEISDVVASLVVPKDPSPTE